MRGRAIILVTLLGLTAALPDPAQAQLSPQGVFNTLTRPFRDAFGRLRHVPRTPHRRTAKAGEPAADESEPLRLGVAGPPAWPGAYEDVVGYALWQDDYPQRLTGRGFGVIADTIAGRFEMPRAPTRTASTSGAAPNDAANACGDAPGAQDDWPSARIEQTAKLSEAQKAALGKLQAAVEQSAKAIKANCSNDTPAPPERLKLLVQTIWSVRDAGVGLRAPLEDFYNALTEEQKAGFTSRPPQDKPDANAKGANNKNAGGAAARQQQACAGENIGSAERLIKAIEKRVKPNKDQAASLENLHETSTGMAKLLMASCMQPVPADPLARLDAAVNQLTTMNYAATTVQIAYNDFYRKLDDKQKSRLDRSER